MPLTSLIHKRIVDSVENPIRVIRGGASLELFSTRCHVHLQALYLNECGVYTDVLPKIMKYLVHLGYDEQSVNSDYHAYQLEKRTANGVDRRVSFVDLGPPILDEGHPFIHYRTKLGLSRLGFAKSFCVHPASLYKLEYGDSIRLPEQLREALTQAGVPDSVISELNERCEEYAHGQWDHTPL